MCPFGHIWPYKLPSWKPSLSSIWRCHSLFSHFLDFIFLVALVHFSLPTPCSWCTMVFFHLYPFTLISPNNLTHSLYINDSQISRIHLLPELKTSVSKYLKSNMSNTSTDTIVLILTFAFVLDAQLNMLS